MIRLVKRRRTAFIGVCIVCIVGWPLQASAASAWDLISPQEFDPHSKLQRLAVARDLGLRVARLADLITDQQPDEVARLEQAEAKLGAAATMDDAAAAELQLSVAYQHRKLIKLLTDIRTALDCVINSEHDAAEMLCWAQASRLMADEQPLRLALGTLRNSRRLPQNKDLPPLLRGPEVWYGTYARGILQYILIPYLAEAAAAKR
jgi:hypothetical protein